ncbi:mediator of RNA polymerase II transcription subunit 8-like [Gigantopelta aegis]|uniref:mediator of RNA polymerase II transcription subunit 8-like n=1 Tax=Gigantopelta aegis TaxID=1735272 RepID=UPI001B8893D7|nr:mediator of RNA polymerase II transcription subunit 8-like [Gigantopelta aegis]
MQNKEEKHLELSLEAVIKQVQDLKNSVTAFLFKLEEEYHQLNWPSVLDNFALLSGQLNVLGKLLKSDKIPALRNYALFPVLLSPDRDPELEKLTEGRVSVFNHEVAPDYLRTKPDADAEVVVNEMSSKVASISSDAAMKQLVSLNKVTSNILDLLNSAREQWDKDASQRTAQPQTSSLTDTHMLIAALQFGKGLRLRRPDTPQQQQQHAVNVQQHQKQGGSVGKAQSAVRTNIKAAVSSSPYQRS